MSTISVQAYSEKIDQAVDDVECDERAVPSLEISIFDKETGIANSCGTTVTAENGDFIEELTNKIGDNCSEFFIFSAALERAGTYDITVMKDGYADWYKPDNKVTSNRCHVNTVNVEAYLEK